MGCVNVWKKQLLRLCLLVHHLEKYSYLYAQKLMTHKKMETKSAKSKNFINRLLECKRELRECIRNGADPKEMKRIASKYGFTFATPL